MKTETKFPFHYSYTARINAPPQTIFEFLDDPRKISSHMEKSSWMMAGSSMNVRLDERQGKELGSEIILDGSMMGIHLFVREFVTERKPPIKKVWETSGNQKLVILEQYRMGFSVTGDGPANLTVFIDYSLPQSGPGKLLGKLLGRTYAKWCTKRMAKDAANRFA